MPSQTSAPTRTRRRAHDTTPAALEQLERRAGAAIRATMARAAGELETPPRGLETRAAMEWHAARVTTTARAHFVPASGNRKVAGAAPASTITTSRDTCPRSCPLRATPKDGGEDHAARIAAGESVSLSVAGCYADAQPMRGVWDAVTRGDYGGAWVDTCRVIADTPGDGRPVRLAQAGEIIPAGSDGRPDWHAVAMLAHALTLHGAPRGATWGYTHQRPTPQLMAILERFRAICGAVVTLSANGPDHADILRAAYPGASVAAVVAHDTPTGTRTPAGAPIAICPAQTTEGTPSPVSCSTCGGARGPLCARGGGPVIGFRAHGMAFKRAELAIAAGGAA
jgi:hypothetical protein